jgi:hypothetical protein
VKKIDSNNTNIIQTLADIFIIMFDLGTDLVADCIKRNDLKKRLKL